MSDENESIKDKVLKEIKADKKFFIRVAVISLLILIGYYMFSPYQKCLSANSEWKDPENHCLKITKW